VAYLPTFLLLCPQVDIDMIIERNRISVMNEAVEQLNEIAQEWKNNSASVVPEVDWSKMRQLEFQENLRSRNALETRLEGKGCILCQDLEDHVRILSMMLSLVINSQKL
jgi:antiviral helicase SKI2